MCQQNAVSSLPPDKLYRFHTTLNCILPIKAADVLFGNVGSATRLFSSFSIKSGKSDCNRGLRSWCRREEQEKFLSMKHGVIKVWKKPVSPTVNGIWQWEEALQTSFFACLVSNRTRMSSMTKMGIRKLPLSPREGLHWNSTYFQFWENALFQGTPGCCYLHILWIALAGEIQLFLVCTGKEHNTQIQQA